MSISLFKHNEAAYQAVLFMLANTGKAAVVHPTGTGKSFIGFKLCEDHPNAVVCWLSPSEYIFSTQLENLRIASDGYVPRNIRFYTYARLMLMTEEALADIQPDYIILDEFHRCGAEMWSRGVENLLAMYPDTPILGLSATNIRYLDDQRDMADELFDGNIASEMTLGEAIVRGILNTPRYIQSLFSYQQDLKRYERRVQQAKSAQVRAAGEQYLEAIRRAIDLADGLDVVFHKHMTDPRGKYLVFCSNKEHMDEMVVHVPEWFHKVDKSPKVYTVYTEDPSASRSFQAFKEDKDASHLRLLFAIDALNEGIHIDDISGVILLRPTISPIIYKQQIGRALSTGSKNIPVIFDIVNNIDGLYSIGTIQEEMQAAVAYYRSHGEHSDIVTDRFQIIDEVRSCRELFEQLEETLSASWDMMYSCAKRYYEDHGNLDIPKRYKTSQGYSLGSWLTTQRMVRAGEKPGRLGRDRIAKLDAIGMRWESASDLSWRRFFTAAEEYSTLHGTLDMKVSHITQEGIRLGAWISNLRTYRRSGIRTRYLTQERIAALDALGMVWDQPDYIWERNYTAALQFYQANGHLSVPHDYVSGDGTKLGQWLHRLRSGRRTGRVTLTDEQMHRLEELHMVWTDRGSKAWEQGFQEAEKYWSTHHKLDADCHYITGSGYALGKWLARQRDANKSGRLSHERKSRLDGLGMVWDKSRSNPWEVCYALANSFYEANGHLRVPARYVADGVWLNKWINEQKQIYLGKRVGKSLTSEQIKKLECIGMCWD